MTNIGSLLGDAATLMITGMSVVFIFLTILVYLVRLMSKLVPEEVPEPIAAPKKIQKSQSELPLATDSIPNTPDDLKNFKGQLSDILKILK